MHISSTGSSRRPLGPAIATIAPAAIIAGTLSAAGEALHRLPTIVARPWIWVEPIRSTASTTPGHILLTSGCSPSSAPVTAAPMRKPPFSAVISWTSGIRFTSTTSSGSIMPARSCTRRSVPPASTRASPPRRRAAPPPLRMSLEPRNACPGCFPSWPGAPADAPRQTSLPSARVNGAAPPQRPELTALMLSPSRSGARAGSGP